MSYREIPIIPGVYKDDTPLKAQGFAVDADKIRYYRGLAQLMGGWELLCPTALTGKIRALLSWQDYSSLKWVAAGSNSNVYLVLDSLPYDCTPVVSRGNAAVNFTTINTSAVVTAGWALHNMVQGQAFQLSNATVPAVGGVTINTPAPTTTAPSPWYIVLAVTDANTFTFTAAQPATSGAGPTASTVDYRQFLAPGLIDGIGALGFGAGTYDTGTYSSPATGAVSPLTWSLVNYGQNLIASPRGGKMYEMAPAAAATELVTNGSFTGGSTGWTLGTGWAYATNNIAATNATGNVTQSVTTPANTFCVMALEVSAFSTGIITAQFDGATVIPGKSANGRYFGTFFATGGAKTLSLVPSGNFTGTIDNVSVQQLTTLEVIPNAPTQNTCVLVTPEGFVMAAGTVEAATGNFNPMHVRISDIISVVKGEQDWTPGATDESNFWTLAIGSRIVGAAVSGTETLVWTDKALYAWTFVNNTNIVYSVRLVGTSCGLIGPKAMAVLGSGVFWMTPDGNTYGYAGGAPTVIKSGISKDVFDHIALSQQDKISAGAISKFNDVLWLYPDSRDGNECSRYALLDTLEFIPPPAGTNPGAVGCFVPGTFDRTAWADAGVLPYPIAADAEGFLYFQEKGATANGASFSGFILTGSIQIGDGSTLWQVKSFIPDFAGLQGGATLTAYGYKYPQSTPTVTGPFMFTSASEKIDMLAGPPIGREVAFRFDFTSSPVSMRTGKLMMDIEDTGMAF